MTVASTTNRVSYAGNGTTTDFAFPHPYRASSDLLVTLRTTATGAEVAQVEGVNYTVSGTPTSDAGGFASATVSFGTAPASGTQVHIDRIGARTQTTDYVAGDGIPPSSIEGSLDKLTQLVQELDSRFERTLLQPRTAANRNLVLPEPTSGTASRVLAVNAGGTAYELRAPDGIPNGDKGDITVSGAGDTWTIDANAVTTAKIADGAVTAAKIGDAELSALAGLTSAANKLPYFTGSGTAALADLTVAGRDLIAGADATAQRGTLGLGTIATQAANNVSITGGSITGITDLAIADGGTGASTASGARANLGLSDGANLNFTQTGTGAVTRSIDARLKDWISVKDFGVVADGTDQTTKIQAAIDAAAAAGGGVVYFPAGTYSVGSTVFVKDNVTLDGDNRQATIRALSTGFNNTDFRGSARYNTNAVVIDMSGLLGSPFTTRNNPGVRGLKITHQSSSGKSLSAIVCRNVVQPIIENCEIYDFSVGCGIRVASARGGRIAGNYIYNLTESDALSAWVETFNGTGAQTVFTLSNPNSYAIALIRVGGVATSAYTYNAGTKQVTFTVAPASGTGNIKVMYNSMQITAIEIDNDVVNGVATSEMVVDGNRISTVKFQGSAATNWLNETDGINVCGGSRCVYSNNTIITVGEGFDVFASFNTFVGNSVWGADNFGFKLTHGASHNTVSGLTLTIMGLAGVTVNGSDITGPVEGNVLSSITIRNIDASNLNAGQNTAGIRITSGTYAAQNNLFSNVFIEAGAYGEYGIYDTTAGGNNYVTGLRAVGSLPAFSARIDNGLTYSAADQVSIHTNATERLRVTNQGVGIGNTAAEAGTVLTAAGVASFGDGTAAAPSVAHRGDLDTGIYFPSAGNAVGIATNGAARVYVDTNGLGINTTSFSTDKLRVQGSASVRYFGVNTDGKAEQRWNDNAIISDGFTIANNGVSASNQGIGLRFNLDATNGAGNESAYIRALSADTYAAAANRSAVLTIGTINANTLAERMRIDNAGNVGIATTAPDTRVHAVNTSAGAATYAAFLQNASSTQNTEVRLAFAANAVALNTGGGRHGYIAGVNTSVGGTATDFVFAPNQNGGSGTERFRIASDGTLTIADAGNLAVGSTTGTKIGTATTQKLAFYNATPIVQRAAAAQAAVATTAATQTTPWGFSTQAQADGIITLVNEIRTTLVNLGLMKGSA